MGVYETINNSSSLVRVDEQIKDMSKDYLIENSKTESIKNNYKLIKKEIDHVSHVKVIIGVDKSGK